MESFTTHYTRLLAVAAALLLCAYSGAQERRDSLRLHRPAAAAVTNLLLPLLNIGVEVPVTNRWSFGAEYYFPWLPRPLIDSWTEPGKNCLQAIGGTVEAHLWLGRMHGRGRHLSRYRLLGHSLDFICAAAMYDWQKDWVGQQGEVYTAGVGYSYTCPLGKECAVYMQFEFALGMAFMERHPYRVYESGGYLIRQKDEEMNSIRTIREQYWGVPVKAGVSLLVPFKIRRER